jgi:hypothetical protein
MEKRRRFLSSAILLTLIVLFLSTLYRIDGSAQEAYPPPATSIPSAPLSTNTIYLPIIASMFPPPAAPSYYITDVDTMYNLGYALGVHDRDTPGTQNNLVILDYGYPAKQGSMYGVFLVFDETGTFYSTSQVVNSATAFAQGYYYGASSDLSSHLRIVIGVNSCCNENTLAFFQGHGTAWGQANNSVISGISSYSSQVDAVGGSDIEMSFNDPYTTAQWFNNFMAANTCVPGSNSSVDGCFYNFGNLTISISGTTCATSESDPWRACDVWYVSWGAQKNGKRFARPLPEIYVRYNPSYPQYPWGQNATAWKDLSLFSADQMSAGKMYFVGTLTQRARCGDGCGSGNNYPWEGYNLLYSALASNPTTSMSLRWSTDITIQPTP